MIKDSIINLLNQKKVAQERKVLKSELNLFDEELDNALNELIKEGIIYKTNKKKYILVEQTDYIKGYYRSNPKGYGFVEVEGQDEDIYINEKNTDGAILNDLVLVEIIKDSKEHKKEGKIIRVINRPEEQYVGEINFDKKETGTITFDDKRINIELSIPKENSLNAVDGHKVLVEIKDKVDKNKYIGNVVKIIGHKNDPGTDILSIIYKYKIHTEFNEQIQEELKKLPNKVDESELSGRLDLRNEMIFTIDGDDTKDIDDAISIEKLNNGHYKLGVHIADVAYYVKEDTALDEEASYRGCSVYLVDRVIPMLPHELSNGICSLNPNVDRLTVSCIMEFDGQGNKLDYDVKLSVIKSNIQMTYKKVNAILNNEKTPEGYEPYKEKLLQMQELSEKISNQMIKRGYLDFNIDEPKILVDENCVPIEIKKREQGKGEKLIENFMVQANESVASLIYFMNLPFIYRIHEEPQEDKIKGFEEFLQSLGYTHNLNLKDLSPKNIQKLLNFINEKKESKILSSLLLRSMKKAIYSTQNLGHYALASKCYTHFTSPIRRYPDTTVHRLLHKYIFENQITQELVDMEETKLIAVAEHSSEMEKASVDCERDVDDMKMAEYMEKHINEEYDGMISGIANFGMFVMLDNLIEGLVPIDSMNDFYVYDEKLLTLTGQKSHTMYRIGDKVKVKCIRASKEDKQIDFDLLKKY